MKKFILIFLITLLLAGGALSLAAQEKEDKNVVFRLNLLPLGGGVEIRIKDNFTLLGHGGVAVNLEPSDDDELKFKFIRYVLINPRYYNNLDKRKQQLKRVGKFAANYVGFVLGQVFKSSDIDRRTFIGPVWGMQRNIGKNGYFDFNIGIVIIYEEDKTEHGILLGITLGFAF